MAHLSAPRVTSTVKPGAERGDDQAAAVEVEVRALCERLTTRDLGLDRSSDRQNFTDRRQGSPTETPAKSLPLSSLSNSFRRLGNLTLRKGCGAWLTLRFDGDVAMA